MNLDSTTSCAAKLGSIQLDSAYLWLHTCPALDEKDGHLLRGFFGRKYENYAAFHHHGENGLIYQHPLIQYKVVDGKGLLTGLGQGSYLIASIKPPSQIQVNKRLVSVVRSELNRNGCFLGISNASKTFRFISPWLGLNSRNKKEYDRLCSLNKSTDLLFSRILIGNLISLSKALRYNVTERIKVSVNLSPAGIFTVKPGTELLGFTGEFSTNFEIPDYWGIGKSSSRGFGAIETVNAQ